MFLICSPACALEVNIKFDFYNIEPKIIGFFQTLYIIVYYVWILKGEDNSKKFTLQIIGLII